MVVRLHYIQPTAECKMLSCCMRLSMMFVWTSIVWLPWSAYKQIEHCTTYLRTVISMVISMFTSNNPNNCA